MKTWVDPMLVRIRNSGSAISRLQGNIKSSVLMIAPIPTEKEVQDNLAWSNSYAEIFFEMLAAVSAKGPNDFLIMPTIFGTPKRKKVSSEELAMSMAILSAASRALTVTGFVCIGSEAFRLFFGYGKRPSMAMLNGAVLRVSQTNNKPLVVVPDLEPLLFNSEGLSRRDFGIAQQQQRSTLRTLEESQVFRKIDRLFIK